jgi:hypothetical protein
MHETKVTGEEEQEAREDELYMREGKHSEADQHLPHKSFATLVTGLRKPVDAANLVEANTRTIKQAAVLRERSVGIKRRRQEKDEKEKKSDEKDKQRQKFVC